MTVKRTLIGLVLVVVCVAASLSVFLNSQNRANDTAKTRVEIASVPHNAAKKDANALSVSSTSPYAARWRDALHGTNEIVRLVPELIGSKDPNDWVLAANLQRICLLVAGTDTFGEKAASLIPSITELSRVRKNAKLRCAGVGGNGDELAASLNQTRGAIANARKLGAILAQPPAVTSKEILDGADESKISALRSAFIDPAVTEVWVGMNASLLTSAMRRLPEFSGIDANQLLTALYLAQCSSGGGCRETSLLTVKLCEDTAGGVCNSNGVEAAAIKKYGVANLPALRDVGERALNRLSRGELEELGIRAKTK